VLSYGAAQRVSCGEWVFFGALLISFAASAALITWALVAVIRRVMGI
jgi:hypothetical protein